jgi:hypothetical protein
MGRIQLIVLSRPRSGDITDMEEAIQRCVEVAPIDFVDAFVLNKDDNDAIEFAGVRDIERPERAWRGVLAAAFFGSDVVGIAPWTMPPPPDEPDAFIDLKEVHLLEISDRIPRNSSSLLVLVEHRWMDELGDDQIAPGHLIANGWISLGALVEMGNARPHHRFI